jgi:glycosyltransferase involved in cell wall biosynthesis
LGNSPLVGIVGGLIPWKGHCYFLEAAFLISRKFSEVKFLVVGEDFVGGRYRRQLEDLSFKLGLSDKVVFTGFRQDIPEILGSLEILVLTSLKEPFGRVLIEAMACAKPVVATNAGGVPEIVREGETGLLVPMRDPEALARSIKLLLNNKEKAKEMGEKGRRRVEENFTIEAHVKKVESLYQVLR